MNLPFVTDSHCHLDFPDFENNLEETIEKAVKSGVTRMVTICTKLQNEPTVRGIAEKFDCVFYAAGTHPMNAHNQPMICLLYTSPSPRDRTRSRMPSSA